MIFLMKSKAFINLVVAHCNLKLFFFVLCGFLWSSGLNAQQKIDGSFSLNGATPQKYSLYLASGFKSGGNAVLAFHPLNTARWNGQSWRDTLVAFAEINNVLLICPDGGPDGRVNDDEDTSFTTALLDSVSTWYTYRKDLLVGMGFSWGGLTTYTYGLSHPEKFKGLIPIGAAINGDAEIKNLAVNAHSKNIYIIHGAQDIPQTRYYPALQTFSKTSACVEDTLMSGIGHTIDFPRRNQILTAAYQWILSNNCKVTGIDLPTNAEKSVDFKISFFQQKLMVEILNEKESPLSILDMNGKLLATKLPTKGLNTYDIHLNSGIYLAQYSGRSVQFLVP